MTSSNTAKPKIEYIKNCRRPERRKELLILYNITPSFRFIAPGFKTCGQPKRELGGVVSVFKAIPLHPTGKEHRIVCGQHCANHFCRLLEQNRTVVKWPPMEDPYASEGGHHRDYSHVRGESEGRSLLPADEFWLTDLAQVCNILLIKLRCSKGTLLSIFEEIKTGLGKESHIKSVNTIADQLLRGWDFEDISKLTDNLDAGGSGRLRRPDFSRLETIRVERFPDYPAFPKRWVLR